MHGLLRRFVSAQKTWKFQLDEIANFALENDPKHTRAQHVQFALEHFRWCEGETPKKKAGDLRTGRMSYTVASLVGIQEEGVRIGASGPGDAEPAEAIENGSGGALASGGNSASRADGELERSAVDCDCCCTS